MSRSLTDLGSGRERLGDLPESEGEYNGESSRHGRCPAWPGPAPSGALPFDIMKRRMKRDFARVAPPRMKRDGTDPAMLEKVALNETGLQPMGLVARGRSQKRGEWTASGAGGRSDLLLRARGRAMLDSLAEAVPAFAPPPVER